MCEKVKVIVFDMDGVLVTCRSSWRKLHLHFGSEAIINEANDASRFRNGEISYLEWMRRDTEAIIKANGGKVTREEIEEALKDIEIDKDAPKVVSYAKMKGIKTVIVSGGIDILANRLKRTLGIDYVYANKLIFNSLGELLPGGIEVVNPLKKSDILRELSSELDIPLSKFMYIGDSEWDKDALEFVGYPVFYKRDSDSPPQIKGLIVIERLGEVIEVLQNLGC